MASHQQEALQPLKLAPRSAEAALVRLCGISPEIAVALVHGTAKDAEGEALEVEWGTPAVPSGKAATSGHQLMEAHCGTSARVQGPLTVEESLRLPRTGKWVSPEPLGKGWTAATIRQCRGGCACCADFDVRLFFLAEMCDQWLCSWQRIRLRSVSGLTSFHNLRPPRILLF